MCTLCCFRILSYWAYIFFFSFSFVEICLDCLPFVSNPPFLQHPVPVEISVAWGTSTHTLKKLTRKKKIEEQKKKKRKEKKKSFMISIAFLRNCQTCIHTDPDATRSSTYTLPPPPTLVQIKHCCIFWFGPRGRRTDFSTRTCISTWPVNDCRSRRQKRKREKRKGKEDARIYYPLSLVVITCCFVVAGKTNIRTHNLCQVLPSYSI